MDGRRARPSDAIAYGLGFSLGMIARVAAVASLAGAVVLVALLLLGSGPDYILRAEFQDAGGLVTGDDVMIGPAKVGSVQSIGLAPDGLAEVKFSVDSSAAPMHQGTVARVYENSLSGIANRYVVLEPGPGSAPEISNNGLISRNDTYSFVSLDQLFDTLDAPTRAGLRGFIRGESASINGKATEANETLRYLAPALSSTSNVTQKLARDEPAFDGLLVQGANALRTLASRSNELSQLVANTNATTSAIASQSRSLQQALALLPPALNHSTRTFAGVRKTLDSLDPLVAASKPASRRLKQFSEDLDTLTKASIPTIGALNNLIRNPSGSGDLISLLQQTPSLAKVAHTAFPELIKEMNQSQNQLDYLREFAPDVVAALTNLGQSSAYYDANGHFARTQPMFSAFGLDGFNQLTTIPPSARYQGLHVVHGRCPGGAIQPPPDGSAPVRVPGCNPASTPPGP
jgi:phospholipid/cholesterol/gamma-HCH transport system substrate-binding protein